MVYIGIARGSPCNCVVPSRNSKDVPSMKRREAERYVLVRMFVSGGHNWNILRRAAQRLRELKVLEASTNCNNTPSVP